MSRFLLPPVLYVAFVSAAATSSTVPSVLYSPSLLTFPPTTPLLIKPSPTSPDFPHWTSNSLADDLPHGLEIEHKSNHAESTHGSSQPFTFSAFDPQSTLTGQCSSCHPIPHDRQTLPLKEAITAIAPPFFAKLSPKSLPTLLAEQVTVLADAVIAGADSYDYDVWIGTENWRTHTHYDFQHNYYHQIHGRKHFILSPPATAAMYPHLHPRYRQTKAVGREGLEVTVEEGEILYIPPMWLHTATTASEFSISIAVCKEAVAEDIALTLEEFAIPVESEWGAGTTRAVLRRYFEGIDGGAVEEVEGRYDEFEGVCDSGGDSVELSEIDWENVANKAAAIKAYIEAQEIEPPVARLLLANYFENVAAFVLPIDQVVQLFTAEC